MRLNTIALILLLALIYKVSLAQDTLIVSTMLGAVKIENRNGDILKLGYVLKSAKEIPDAQKHFKRARLMQAGNLVFGLPAGALIGYQLGYYIPTSRLHSKPLLFAGLGLLSVSHTFALLRNRAIKKGAVAYNKYIFEQKQQQN